MEKDALQYTLEIGFTLCAGVLVKILPAAIKDWKNTAKEIRNDLREQSDLTKENGEQIAKLQVNIAALSELTHAHDVRTVENTRRLERIEGQVLGLVRDTARLEGASHGD